MRSGVCKPKSRRRPPTLARIPLLAALILAESLAAPAWRNCAAAQEPTEAAEAPTGASFTRRVPYRDEVTGAPHLEIRHEEGHIRVRSWANPVVAIEATITAPTTATRSGIRRSRI